MWSCGCRHIPRLNDFLWVAEDGMKMQGYNGSQLWDTTFAVQAICATGLAAEFTTCLRKAQHYVDVTQVSTCPHKTSHSATEAHHPPHPPSIMLCPGTWLGHALQRAREELA